VIETEFEQFLVALVAERFVARIENMLRLCSIEHRYADKAVITPNLWRGSGSISYFCGGHWDEARYRAERERLETMHKELEDAAGTERIDPKLTGQSVTFRDVSKRR
jgi:hypothetical protein